MNITVIGCGRWGSFIAWYLDRTGHTVTLYGRKSSSHIQQFIETRSNGLLTLPESIQLTSDLDAVDKADVIVISIAAQSLDSLMTQLQTMKLQNKIFVLCMKGIEIGTGRRLSQIASAHLDVSNKVAVWIGPGHVQEFYNGIPNCMVIDSEDEQVKKQLLEAFSSDLIRFYYGQDMIGNEIGGASKNVIGIAAGMLDGLQAALLQGAYTPDTPAALVYKATWPEEKVVRCRLGALAQAGRENNISKTALVLVGDFLAPDYERSKLYDPSFATEFREAKP